MELKSYPFLCHCFHSYLIEGGVCYLVLCEKGYSKRLAFGYLEELQQEFYEQYSRRVSTVSRPYSFIEFGEYSQKLNGYC